MTNSGTGVGSNEWSIWITTSDSTTASNDASTVWGTWASTSTATYNYPPSREIPDEERARIEENRRQYENQKRQAEKTAEKLLLSHLNQDQKNDWKRCKTFKAISQSNRTFKLRHARNKNIDELNADGRTIATFCIVAGSEIPLCDQLLMQKFMIEKHEDDFLRIANKWDY